MSRPYEALVILKATGTDADLTHAVKQLEEPIKKLGGQVDHSASWGRRRLAYKVAHQSEGYYQLVNFHLPPLQLDELKRLFRLNDAIVRCLILNRADAKTPATAPTPSRPASREARVVTGAGTQGQGRDASPVGG